MNTSKTDCFIGIDVSKAQLDVADPSGEVRWSVPNDPSGINLLVQRLQALTPTLIVLEATGGLQMPAVAALELAGLPVAVVNPRQARDFAKAAGRLAKTDRIDAAMLARFGQALRPEPRPLKPAQTQALEALVGRRHQLLEMLTAERNRLERAPACLHKDLKAHIQWLEKRLKDVDTDLGKAVKATPAWRYSAPGGSYNWITSVSSRLRLAGIQEDEPVAPGQGTKGLRQGLHGSGSQWQAVTDPVGGNDRGESSKY